MDKQNEKEIKGREDLYQQKHIFKNNWNNVYVKSHRNGYDKDTIFRGM